MYKNTALIYLIFSMRERLLKSVPPKMLLKYGLFFICDNIYRVKQIYS